MKGLDDSGHTPPGDGVTHLNVATLYREHAQFVRNFVARMGVPPEEEDDVVHDVFLVAIQRGGFVMRNAKPTTWLCEIAINTLKNWRRKRRRGADNREATAMALLGVPTREPDVEVEAEKNRTRVRTAITKLDVRKRAVIALFDLGDFSAGQIAEVLKIPVGTVHSRLSNARAEFEKHYLRLLAARPEPDPDFRGTVRT